MHLPVILSLVNHKSEPEPYPQYVFDEDRQVLKDIIQEKIFSDYGVKDQLQGALAGKDDTSQRYRPPPKRYR